MLFHIVVLYIKRRYKLRRIRHYTNSAFANANLTGSLIIPQNVVYIGSLAFSDNDFSGDLIIPNKVKIIGSGAFAKNNNATSRYNNLF